MAPTVFDRSVLKVNQVIIMTVLAAGYALSFAWAPAAGAMGLIAVMMLVAALAPAASLSRIVYEHLLRPRGLVRRRPSAEDPAPHRFAQLLGGLVLAAGSACAVTGHLTIGWTLGWLVIALALLNFAFDVCVGCILYVQLARLGVLPLHRSQV